MNNRSIALSLPVMWLVEQDICQFCSNGKESVEHLFARWKTSECGRVLIHPKDFRNADPMALTGFYVIWLCRVRLVSGHISQQIHKDCTGEGPVFDLVSLYPPPKKYSL